jgi:NAD(P)-dependent dehydrogenase (short-subunit alcohol dehydrogenase family)
MSRSVIDTVAIVTGAARGLGRSIAERLAADGAIVAALDLEFPTETGPHGGRSGSIRQWNCDVSDPSRVASVVSDVAAKLGGVDVLVNNAGVLSGRASLLEATPEQMHRYYAVNAIGPLLMVQSCFPHLRDSAHRGRVINIASRTAFTGAPGQLGYVASKGALLAMTKVMARELGSHRITVNAAIPAQVATSGTREHSNDAVFARTMSQQAIQEFVTPEEFAGLVAFLASPDAGLITGQAIVCDGGGFLH